MRTENGKRIEYLDLAKGLCIILVVFYHAKGILAREYWFDPFLASFRMPLYFFLSGLFFRDYGGFKRFFTKKTNRLLVPFLAFYLLTSVLLPNVMHRLGGIEFGTVMGLPSLWAFIWPGVFPNIPIWFLWSLFLMNLLFWWIHRAANGKSGSQTKPYAVWILIMACLICGFIGHESLAIKGFDVAYVFGALASMPFFCVGYLFSSYNGLPTLNNLNKATAFPIFCLMLGICFTCSMFLSSANVEVTYLIKLISGTTGALMIVTLSRMIVRIPFISYIGRYSIILLLTHGVLIRVFAPLCHSLASTLNTDAAILIVTLLILLSQLIIIPIARRYFPHITAQKPLFPES